MQSLNRATVCYVIFGRRHFYEICLERQILVINGGKITPDPKENIFRILSKTTYPGGKGGMEI
jgi:hypothetical protein